MRHPKKQNRNFEVTIEKLVYGGSGFARHEGKVVFVPFSVPGDRLIVRPVDEKKTFVRAEIVQILEPGSGRVTPACPYFGECGGCHWQQLEYSRQVEAKRLILEEVFHHRFPQTQELPITMAACQHPLGYRSRARIQTRGAGEFASIGFFRCGSHVVVDVEQCPLFRNSLNEALASLRQYKLKVDSDPQSQEMDLACSEEEDSWASARSCSAGDEGVTPLLGSRRRPDEVLLRRKVGDFTYEVTASVFFQANDFMVSELVALVANLARDAGSGAALDLFSGVGLFSLPLARQFEEVIAVEGSAEANRLCVRNANTARLGNIRSVCADVSEWMDTPPASGADFDLIVLDPPRTGTGPGVIEKIRARAPQTIIYISCDPQTLIRDLAAISPRDYRITFIKGLDMFPQAYHFETVVQLKKN